MFFDNLDYYILAEVCTVIFSLVLLYNVFVTFSPYERKHRLFLYATIGCLLSAVFDIISVFCTTYYKVVDTRITIAIQTLFYLMLITVPLLITIYSLDLAYKNHRRAKIMVGLSLALYIGYFILLMVNIKTGIVFTADKVNGYQRGPLKNITYILTIVYMVIIEVTLITHHKAISKRIAVTIFLYPVIGVGILIFQYFFPTLLLTGTASLASILLCYMAIQSDMLDFDMVTGLMSEHKLESHIRLKNTSGILFVLSIDNIDFFEANMIRYDYEAMLLEIGKKFQKLFDLAYYSPDHKFSAIVKTEDNLMEKYEELKLFFDEMYRNNKMTVSIPIEYYAAVLYFNKGEKSYSNVKSIITDLLVRAKIEGSKDIKFCDETVLMEMARKEQIFKILKRELTLESKQFNIHYQPIFSVKENRFVYMEALARLGGTEIGNISPAEFVPVAESRGLIERLGNVAFEKICKFIADNRSVVNAVSINFSVYQMTNPSLVDNVLNTITRFGLNPSNIIMEITESIFIDNYDLVAHNMQQLANAGIKFYLDDFGNGYSNLANVVELPFSTVKMDRTLVLAMENSQKNSMLFTNLVSTFKGANLNVLVEGIENDSQNAKVLAAGVDYIQGFLYSRPLPEEECLKLLRK